MPNNILPSHNEEVSMYATVYASCSDISMIFMMSVSYEVCSQCWVLEQSSVGALFFWDLLFKASRLLLFLLSLLTARDAAWQQQTAWRRSQSQNHPWQIFLLILPVPVSPSSNFASPSSSLASSGSLIFFSLFIHGRVFAELACSVLSNALFHIQTVAHFLWHPLVSEGSVGPLWIQRLHWRNQVFVGDVKHPVAGYWTGGNNDC